MAQSLSILCVHGVGHGDNDTALPAAWSKVIEDSLLAWNPALQGAITCDFLLYDKLFEKAPLNPVTYAKAYVWLVYLTPSSSKLVSEVQARLKQLKYQLPNLVWPKRVLELEVPWGRMVGGKKGWCEWVSCVNARSDTNYFVGIISRGVKMMIKITRGIGFVVEDYIGR